MVSMLHSFEENTKFWIWISFCISLQSRGTPANGKKNCHSHAISRYSGKSNFHLQKRRDASTGGGFNAKKRRYMWSTKNIRRHRTGTGRCRSLKNVNRKEKNGYRTGTQATPKVKAWATIWECLTLSSEALYGSCDPTKNCLKVIINVKSLHFNTEVTQNKVLAKCRRSSAWLRIQIPQSRVSFEKQTCAINLFFDKSLKAKVDFSFYLLFNTAKKTL